MAIYELHPLYFPLFVAALICNSNTWRSNYSLWIPRHLTLHWTINLSLSRWWVNSSSVNLESPVRCFSFRFGFLFWRATVQRDRSRQMLHMQIDTACWKYLEVEGEKVTKATWGRGEKGRRWKSNKGVGIETGWLTRARTCKQTFFYTRILSRSESTSWTSLYSLPVFPPHVARPSILGQR